MIEEIKPGFVKRIVPSQRLFRLDSEDDRYYYNESKRGYLSVTSAIKKSLPISPGLLKYYADNGWDAVQETLNSTSEKGTMMHMVFLQIINEGRGNFEQIWNFAFDYAKGAGYEKNAAEWADFACKATASLLTFFKEKEVDIIAAEFPVASNKYNVAGMIDLICEMTFNKKRVNAIVDYKSGMKAFYPSHEAQLQVYKMIFNEVYGDIVPVEMIFNWSPKDFIDYTNPTYNLKNQTGTKYTEEIMHKRLEILNLEGDINPPTSYQRYVGDFEIFNFDAKKSCHEYSI